MEINFTKTKSKPRVGMFVALHNIFPVTKKGQLGVIVDIKKDPLGFNYGVFDFYDKKVYYQHISNIIPLKESWDEVDYKKCEKKCRYKQRFNTSILPRG